MFGIPQRYYDEKVVIDYAQRFFQTPCSKENILCKVNEIVEISKQKYCGELLLGPDAVNGKCMFTINAEEIKKNLED